MWTRLLMLAQEAAEDMPTTPAPIEDDPGLFVFHWWQGVAVVLLIAVIIGYKKYRDKTMV